MQLDTFYEDNSPRKQQHTGLLLGIQVRCFSFLILFFLWNSGSEKKTPYFIGTFSTQSGEDLRRSQVRIFLQHDLQVWMVM